MSINIHDEQIDETTAIEWETVEAEHTAMMAEWVESLGGSDEDEDQDLPWNPEWDK